MSADGTAYTVKLRTDVTFSDGTKLDAAAVKANAGGPPGPLPARPDRTGLPTLEDAVERSSILVGSPQQIIDKVHRYHARLGHEVMHLHADADGLTDKQHRAALELFQAEIAPALRRDIPSRPLGGSPK